MALFNKSADKVEQITQEMKKVENEAISSIIDKNMAIIGEIDFQGKARIDGTVEGNIKGEHLILSESGRIKGDVQMISLNCYGIIEGDVKTEILTARKGCEISGTLETKALTVEPGASIQGNITSGVSEEEEKKLLPKGVIPPTATLPKQDNL